jgi:hypothetical protein
MIHSIFLLLPIQFIGHLDLSNYFIAYILVGRILFYHGILIFIDSEFNYWQKFLIIIAIIEK